MPDKLPPARVVVREVDLSAQVRHIWGDKWNEPEVEYEFSNGRTFTRRTEDAGIYRTDE